MSKETIEFSPIKTIKLINKTDLLKTVYNESNTPYNYMALKAQIETEKLPSDTLESLESIFDAVIKNRDSYLVEYMEIQEVEATPRRYGKLQIQKDIIAQGGDSTELQKTMLALNELKSMYLNLNGKGVSDHYKSTEKLSVAEQRAIRSAVSTFRKMTASALKRKK